MKTRASSYELTQRYWEGQISGDFKSWRDRSLHDGFVAGSAAAPKAVSANVALPPAAAAGTGLEIIFRRDATIYDGRFANNGWLQETPKPMTQICWDNPVLMRNGHGEEAEPEERRRSRVDPERPQGQGLHLDHAGASR